MSIDLVKYGYIYVGVSVVLVIIGGFLIYQLESTKQETQQNPNKIAFNQTDPLVTYMEQNSPVDIIGTVDDPANHLSKGQYFVEGYYFLLILNETEASKLGILKTNELSILNNVSGKLTPDLQDKLVKIHGYFIGNFTKFMFENHGFVTSAGPDGPVIVAKTIDVLK